jgi:hypothetical protein
LKRKNRKGIRQADLVVLVALASLVLCSSCGQRGSPVVPQSSPPPAVTDLRAVPVGDKLQLTWSLPRQGDRVYAGLDQFKLYKHVFRRPADWCADCPVPFREFLDIFVGAPWPARIEGDRVIFMDTMEADHLYAYKVVTYHRNGAASQDSNLAFWPEPTPREPDPEPQPPATGGSQEKNE